MYIELSLPYLKGYNKLKKMIKKFTIIAAVLGGFFPLGLVLITGNVHDSISAYYYSSASLFYTIALTIISSSFIMEPSGKFRLSGVLLLGSTYADYIDHYEVHATCAILFFIYTAVRICKDKRFRTIGYAMFCVAPVAIFNKFIGEVLLLELIVLYNLLYANLVKKKLN